MNFKTTTILLVVLAVVGLVVFFTRDTGETPGQTQQPAGKVLTLKAEDVASLTIEPRDGQKVSLKRDDTNWLITEPLSAPAETWTVEDLLRTLAELESRGRVELTSQQVAAAGLDQPRFVVTVTDKSGKSTKLQVGQRAAAGGSLYVRKEGEGAADIVEARLYEQLDKPLDDFRRKRLIDVASTGVMQLKVQTPDGILELHRGEEKWRIVQPRPMPADETAVSDLLMAVTGLTASEFVASPGEPKRYQLDAPSATVSFTTAAPSEVPDLIAATAPSGAATGPTTGPATAPATQPVWHTVKFGRYDDVLKKNVYVSLDDGKSVAKVPANVLDRVRKTPLELRDKQVLSIQPGQVSRVALDIHRAATTQPATRPAEDRKVVLEREKRTTPAAPEPPVAPTTEPATAPTATAPTTEPATSPTTEPTTQPATEAATQPAEPASEWKLVSADRADANDDAVRELLQLLNPLRATRFRESAPTSQPVNRYELTVETAGERHVLRVTDLGDAEPLLAEYNGLVFEVERSLADKLTADFAKNPTTNPTTQP